MKNNFRHFVIAVFGLLLILYNVHAQTKSTTYADLKKSFQAPPESAKPWVFWYWMQAAISREGITADLEAMKYAGIGGAYLMPIKGVANPPLIDPPVEQLTPEWWKMVQHAMNEADRLGLKLAMHACDGFATAGGPWITPELSMQKVVWSETYVTGGAMFNDTLQRPPAKENYYRDIAFFAFPTQPDADHSSYTMVPKVTTSKPDVNAQFLTTKNDKQNFRSEDSCWIQYEFEKPFTCRSITIKTEGRNYFANRFRIEVSNDGKNFRSIGQLQPPRHGWQDNEADVTHAIVSTTATHFRFMYSKEGSEPGAEDLDAAKWKPSLSLRGIELSGAPRLHHFEGKTGEVWRISPRTTSEQLPDQLCVPMEKMVDITERVGKDGRLVWNIPPGDWTILRIGHTSTGQTNYIGGKGLGLECDKFNPAAIKLQFDNWFGEAFRNAGPALASRVLKIFHVDSWECGSQNWSPVFRQEFQQRRGYDLYSYLPVMAGIPLQNADRSERFLHDIRQTIAELVVDNFYETMAKLAHEKGCEFSTECVAPTMTSDGIQHFRSVDIPMGEFWLRSPTHDKPNDILDAISGAHIYGKKILQSEAFTQLHMAWDEYPGMLKAMGDRNHAAGINRFVFHVFTHNPWLDRKPGMTLGLTGLYFQRDQTWWKQGRAWVQYIQRVQALLQQGNPVTDIAVFTGEETPRRSILPSRLVDVMPGIIGPERVAGEEKRLANIGQPLQEMPRTIMSSANTEDPEKWIDPLRGYAYDSYNRDALLRLTKVNNGLLELPGGARYKLLVFPGSHKMTPNGNLMTAEVATRVKQLVQEGASILFNEQPLQSPGLKDVAANDKTVQEISATLFGKGAGRNDFHSSTSESTVIKQVGKGRVVTGRYTESSLDGLGIERDFIVSDANGQAGKGIVWTHRSSGAFDIYFISNQLNERQSIEISLRVAGRVPELWDPLTGEVRNAAEWRIEKNRTILPLQLEPSGSIFIILSKSTTGKKNKTGNNWKEFKPVQSLKAPWQVKFDEKFGGSSQPVLFTQLEDWSKHTDSAIRYYSGTATYTQTFEWNSSSKNRNWLALGKIANIAEVKLNGISCGIAWTSPYRVEITKALRQGKNLLTIEVSNTWANRLIGDQLLPEHKRVTKTTAAFRLQGKPLLEAGLLGPVVIEE